MTERPIREGTYSYSNPELDGLYDELFDVNYPYLVVSQELVTEEREALRAEAECYRIRVPRDRLKFCYAPRSLEDMDLERVRALRRCIEEKRPDWVAQIRFALRIEDNDVYKIISYSGVPPYPAVAILTNMQVRGELE